MAAENPGTPRLHARQDVPADAPPAGRPCRSYAVHKCVQTSEPLFIVWEIERNVGIVAIGSGGKCHCRLQFFAFKISEFDIHISLYSLPVTGMPPKMCLPCRCFGRKSVPSSTVITEGAARRVSPFPFAYS